MIMIMIMKMIMIMIMIMGSIRIKINLYLRCCLITRRRATTQQRRRKKIMGESLKKCAPRRERCLVLGLGKGVFFLGGERVGFRRDFRQALAG